MSTPTPRTIKTWSALFVGENAALISKTGHDWRSHPDHYERTSLVKEEDYRALETELTAALARIAELEKDRDEIEAQLSDARSGWESAEANILDGRRQLSESQAQLASAREDSEESLIWLFDHPNHGIQFSAMSDGWARFEGKDYSTLSAAIREARGVTSPPAVAETGEKDAWQPIETAPKDGTRVLLLFMPSEDQCVGSWWPCGDYSKWRIDHVSGYEWEAITDELQPTHWQPLPPPPQGKEQE